MDLTAAYINNLPDSSFLYIEPGGKKDDEGKTTPRSLRHFPVKDESGKIDLTHVRNALARIPQSNVSADAKAKATAEAQRLLESAQKAGTWKRDIKIEKLNDEQHLVFGWLSVAKDAAGNTVVDTQDDVIEPSVLEKAAYSFALESRKASEMHKRIDGVGRLVESVMLTKEKQAAMGIPAGAVPEGWWVGFKIDDLAVWQKVKSGEYSAFSLGGKAVREAV